jgi:hypothetical protein
LDSDDALSRLLLFVKKIAVAKFFTTANGGFFIIDVITISVGPAA